jgi:hypothetical protein
MNQTGSGLGGIGFGALVAGVSGFLVLGSFLLSQAEGPRGLIQLPSPTLDETRLPALFPSPVSSTLTATASPTPSPTASPSITATTLASATATPTTTGTPACSKTPDDWEPYTVQRNENLPPSPITMASLGRIDRQELPGE